MFIMRTFFYLLIISGILNSCISKKIIINNEANIVENISLSNEENMEKQNNFENPEISNTFEYIEYFKHIAMQSLLALPLHKVFLSQDLGREDLLLKLITILELNVINGMVIKFFTMMIKKMNVLENIKIHKPHSEIIPFF